MRQREELSITTAPAAAKRGAHSPEVEPPAENSARSKPWIDLLVSACTTRRALELAARPSARRRTARSRAPGTALAQQPQHQRARPGRWRRRRRLDSPRCSSRPGYRGRGWRAQGLTAMKKIVTSTSRLSSDADDAAGGARAAWYSALDLDLARRRRAARSRVGDLLGLLGGRDHDRADERADDDRGAEPPLHEELAPVVAVAGEVDRRATTITASPGVSRAALDRVHRCGAAAAGARVGLARRSRT